METESLTQKKVETDGDAESYEESCCICFEGQEFILTPCCHLFCLPCIARWIEISGTCPLCRNEFENGVELYNLIGTVEATVKAIKEFHVRRRELEIRRREMQQRARMPSSGWGLINQVIDLLFPSETEVGDQMMSASEEGGDDSVHERLAASLNLTTVSLSSIALQQSQGIVSSQLNVSPSFPFLSFCCLPQPPQPVTVLMPPPLPAALSSQRNRLQ